MVSKCVYKEIKYFFTKLQMVLRLFDMFEIDDQFEDRIPTPRKLKHAKIKKNAHEIQDVEVRIPLEKKIYTDKFIETQYITTDKRTWRHDMILVAIKALDLMYTRFSTKFPPYVYAYTMRYNIFVQYSILDDYENMWFKLMTCEHGEYIGGIQTLRTSVKQTETTINRVCTIRFSPLQTCARKLYYLCICTTDKVLYTSSQFYIRDADI